MIKLTYGNTNTFFINGLLVDTDYAGTLNAFYKEISKNSIKVSDIKYVLATHFHPDHTGLIGELAAQGVKLLLLDFQQPFIHFSDRIFKKDKLSFVPLDVSQAKVISCEESRKFLEGLGIAGEIIRTSSHSEDSIALVLDDGDCFVGDLEPYEYIEAYGNNDLLKKDWDELLLRGPKRIFYAHAPAKDISAIRLKTGKS